MKMTQMAIAVGFTWSDPSDNAAADPLMIIQSLLVVNLCGLCHIPS
jgi:hypothetical protein